MKNHYQLGWKTRLLDLLIKSSKPLEQMSLDELKEASEKPIPSLFQRIFFGKQIPVNKIVQQNISGRHGDIPIRLYYPSKANSLPLILFLHGGGWIYGNFDLHDRFCRRITRDTGAIVLAVGYRLAPFHKYPVALEDCYDALSWTIKNAANISIDPKQIIVMGDSAGGNLATALCLMTRDLKEKWITKQILIYPAVNGKFDLPSVKKNADAPMLSETAARYAVDCYARDETDILQPYFSPLLAKDLSNIPPALIIVGEYDVVHDQVVAYAARLQEFKVPVKLLDYPQTIHGFMSYPSFCPLALSAFEEVKQYIND